MQVSRRKNLALMSISSLWSVSGNPGDTIMRPPQVLNIYTNNSLKNSQEDRKGR